MQISWRITALVILAATWPQLGCVHLPPAKAVQDARPPQPPPPVTAPKQELTTTQSWLINADALEKAGQINEATAQYEQIRQGGGPEALFATKKIALFYYRSGDMDRAEAEYLTLVKYNKNDVDSLCKLGEIYSCRGLWGTAEKYYRDAVYYNPVHAAAHAGLGMALAQRGEYVQSLESYKKVGTEAEAYRSVAFVLKLQSKTDDAARALQAAVNLDPENIKAREELAQLRLIAPNAGDTNTIVRVTTPQNVLPQKKVEQGQGNVELVDAPKIALGSDEGTNRLRMQRPTLPPLPDVDLTVGSGREWECSTKKCNKN